MRPKTLKKGYWYRPGHDPIPIRTMGTPHIRRVIAMLERQTEAARLRDDALALSALSSLRGDEAQASVSFASEDENWVGPWDAKIAELESELANRGKGDR